MVLSSLINNGNDVMKCSEMQVENMCSFERIIAFFSLPPRIRREGNRAHFFLAAQALGSEVTYSCTAFI